ncbi:hypothetical protein CVS28_13635 [Arthrobacter glacialis]|nr:hypothetical protein CVS28_13635 [Arthrobacter glacialis]
MRHLLCTGDYGIDIDFFGVGLPEIQASINHSPTALAWLQNASTLVFRGLLLIGALRRHHDCLLLFATQFFRSVYGWTPL